MAAVAHDHLLVDGTITLTPTPPKNPAVGIEIGPSLVLIWA